jgi:hypothetical protein
VQKSQLLAALKAEIQRHDFSHFVDEPPSVAQGDNSVVIVGGPNCRKKFGTVPQFLDHLTHDVLPSVLDRLSRPATRVAIREESQHSGRHMKNVLDSESRYR